MNIKHRNKVQNNKWLYRPKIKWTFERPKLEKALHGLDLESEITAILMQEILNETKANSSYTWKEVCKIVNRES